MIGMKAVMAELAAPKLEVTAACTDFEVWMAVEQKRVYLLCLRMLRNSDDADTATQDVFLRAHRALQRQNGAPIEEPSKWLMRIAVNICLDQLRSKRWLFWRRPPQADEQAILLLAPATGPGPADALFAREIAARLSSALNQLSSRQRSIFVLRHEEDLRLEEIAEILGLDVGTVKSHMARAVRRLRRELRDLYEGKTLE